jgi:hypothetical protein
MSASEDQTVQRGIALPALSSNQMSLAAIVILLGVSYMFNSMVRQVFPALLSAISPHHGPTLPQAVHAAVGAGSERFKPDSHFTSDEVSDQILEVRGREVSEIVGHVQSSL